MFRELPKIHLQTLFLIDSPLSHELRFLGGSQLLRSDVTKISRSQAGSQCLYIAHWRLPEESLVLPIELAWTLVSNFERRARSI
jgi:hypothetical protein